MAGLTYLKMQNKQVFGCCDAVMLGSAMPLLSHSAYKTLHFFMMLLVSHNNFIFESRINPDEARDLSSWGFLELYDNFKCFNKLFPQRVLKVFCYSYF